MGSDGCECRGTGRVRYRSAEDDNVYGPSFAFEVCGCRAGSGLLCDDGACDAAHERDAYRVLLERLVEASDGRPDDPEWLEALYAARNVLRDDQAKEADR
jgi:hypothetical protein